MNDATKAGDRAVPRVACAITHVDEITLDLCRNALERQTVKPMDLFVVSNVSPASVAFNQCLDFALDVGADVLVHAAADCLLQHDAIQRLMRRMDLASTYVVTGRGFDMMNGEDAPVGVWALNMRIIGDRFRFRDAFKMDLDFCERIEAETGAMRSKTKRGYQVGYHHPIWLPREMYQKFRYNAPKYRGKEIKKYLDFFERCLQVNPDNKVLKVGLMGLKRGAAEAHAFGGPVREAFAEEWGELQEIIDFQGGEFFAYHADFISIARELLNSDQPLQPMAGKFFISKKQRLAVERSRRDEALSARAQTPTGPLSTAHLPQPAELSASAAGMLLRGRLRLGRAYRLGLSDAKNLASQVYVRLPEPAKQFYRRLRGIPTPTPKARKKRVLKEGLPLMRYGAINGGREDWAVRWDNVERSRRVLLVAPKDFAGSMYKWTEAINQHTDFAARLIAFEHHQYNYPVDLIVPECDEARLAQVLELASQAGCLHLKDEHSWFLGNEHFTNLKLIHAIFFSEEFASTPKAFTHYGGYARKFKDDVDYIKRVQRFDARIAMTPDLNYEWFNGEYIPHTIDIEKIPYTWTDSKVFAHSPSSPEKKATYLYEEAIQLLPRQYPDVWKGWSVDLIHGVSFAECMLRKQRASLFFDQAGRHRVADLGIDDIIGWYGNSAIEAMAFGIPTIAHMSDIALQRANAAGVDLSDTPVINIDRTRKSLLEAFLKFATLEPEGRSEIAQKTRAFTERFHGYQACGVRLREVYASLISSSTTSQLQLRNAS